MGFSIGGAFKCVGRIIGDHSSASVFATRAERGPIIWGSAEDSWRSYWRTCRGRHTIAWFHTTATRNSRYKCALLAADSQWKGVGG
ncbi:hypothetical protein JYU34_012945 [Plutella xylostella]|uniref:Uncharacterized protein n=1 Tax=Plutella xylostella TaxID=51655 RepID=A0ABQ7QCJ0_PLUXY|nr:hypothetical protein JYU34_012945 [Plutella xylostella]